VRPGHFSAFFCALMAMFGAALAVVGFMFLAFVAAGVANFGANSADFLRKL
jgi:hypothetical protein